MLNDLVFEVECNVIMLLADRMQFRRRVSTARNVLHMARVRITRGDSNIRRTASCCFHTRRMVDMLQRATVPSGTRTHVRKVGALVDVEVSALSTLFAVSESPKGLTDQCRIIDVDMSEQTWRVGAPAIPVVEAVRGVVWARLMRQVTEVAFGALVLVQVKLAER